MGGELDDDIGVKLVSPGVLLQGDQGFPSEQQCLRPPAGACCVAPVFLCVCGCLLVPPSWPSKPLPWLWLWEEQRLPTSHSVPSSWKGFLDSLSVGLV